MRRMAFLFILLLTSPAFAQLTDNHVLHAVPAPAGVKIDGSLSDWDLSGKIFSCPNLDTLSTTTSAYVAMMYDADALYVAVDWSDLSPMLNQYDPQFDQRFCFHSDSIQLHFKTDTVRQVFGWYYTKGKIPAISVTDGERWYDQKPIVYIDGLKDLGITEAFTEKADHTGYIQEMRIPWTAIYKDPKAAPKSGGTIKCMLDLVWGPDAGKGWPIAHLMDLVKPGAAHGDWFWNVNDIRGDIILEPKGNLQLPPLIRTGSTKSRPIGPVAVDVKIPVDAKRFTIAINDASGKRIRNLAGDFDPADFTVSQTPTARKVEVRWDCLDDTGKIVSPGNYSVIGLSHNGLSATYEMHFYNPGTPPWETRDGTGAWGADHSSPRTVAAAGGSVVIAWPGAESGSGVIGVGPDGHKIWGALKGATALAADKDFIYVMTQDFWAGTSGLGRLKISDGSYVPYLLENKPIFPLSLEAIFGGKDKVPGIINSMAVCNNKLALDMSGGEIVILDASTAKITDRIKYAGGGAMISTPDGRLLVLKDHQLQVIKLEALAQPPQTIFTIDESIHPSAIALDAAGHLAIADTAADCQVKLFDLSSGKLLSAFGKKGGRSLRGAFDPQAMTHMTSIAFDKTGNLWVVEGWDYPRRVSVWGADGKLVRDLIGNTAYGAGGGYLHDSDPTLAYFGPMEFKLDKPNMAATLTNILWLPDYNAGESFMIPYASSTGAQRFTSAASGKPHEYLYCHDNAQIVFMPRGPGGSWQPAAGIFLVHHVSGYLNDNDFAGKSDKPPTGELAGLNLRDGILWSDKNRDGKVQRDECVIIKAQGEVKRGHAVDGHGPAPQLSLGDGWGGRIGKDLSIYAVGVVRYKPASFTDDGAPVYDASSIQPLGTFDNGDLVPVDDENKLFICSATGYGETSYVRALDLDSKKELWRILSYCHGVHGSHWAGLPEPGKMIGVIKTLGVAKISPTVGSVVALRGNLGQDFFITSDGLYVGSLFHDCRIPSPAFPTSEKDLQGKDVSEASEGSEPFNGWFGSQSDGRVRICNGMAGLAGTIVDINGLDSIKRFSAPALTIDQQTVVRAEQLAATAPQVETKSYTLKKLAPQNLSKDKPAAFPNDWPSAQIGHDGDPGSAHLRLGYDESNLYAEFNVNDPTPMLNKGEDFHTLFKSGDACDLQLSTDPAAKPHADPLASDLRLVFSKLANGEFVCVLMQPVDPKAPADKKHIYASPVGTRTFDRVEILPDAKVTVVITSPKTYTLQAVIPLQAIHLNLKPGIALRGDFGIISSDSQGTINTARTYWSNTHTGLVSDRPFESWLYPATWGSLKVE